MDEQNFGEHYASSGILDGTGLARENTVGLLSPLPEENQITVSRQPQSSVESPSVPVYDTLDDPNLDLTPASAKITVFPEPLLDPVESELMRTRWNKIQARFVDDPHSSVEMADTLVSDLVSRITNILVEDHNSLESEWHHNNEISTENLRMVLQHYRTFFNRLVD